MPDVTPILKAGPRVKKPKRLKRMGKKMTRDAKEMKETRRALLERSLGRCEAGFILGCTGVGVHAHHIKRRREGGTNDLTNLLWACEPCHAAIHNFPESARERGLLAPKGGQ